MLGKASFKTNKEHGVQRIIPRDSRKKTDTDTANNLRMATINDGALKRITLQIKKMISSSK